MAAVFRLGLNKDLIAIFGNADQDGLFGELGQVRDAEQSCGIGVGLKVDVLGTEQTILHPRGDFGHVDGL